MKALRFHAAKDLRVEDIPLPTEPAVATQSAGH